MRGIKRVVSFSMHICKESIYYSPSPRPSPWEGEGDKEGCCLLALRVRWIRNHTHFQASRNSLKWGLFSFARVSRTLWHSDS